MKRFFTITAHRPKHAGRNRLALATTAAHEGVVVTALDLLGEAYRLARDSDRLTRARVLQQSIRPRLRIPQRALAH